MKNKNLKIAITVACMVIVVNIFTSCKESTQRNVNTDLIIFKRDQIKEIERISFDNTEFIDSCVFVPLETTELSLIGQITLLETFEGRYYIYDRQTKKLKVFGPTGDFLFDIGRKGNGPGEYLGINTLMINPKEKKICLFEAMKMAVIEYNLEGKYLQTKEHYQAYYVDMMKAVYAGDVIYCFSSVEWSDNFAYSIISSNDYSVKKRFSPYPIKPIENEGFIAMHHPFSLLNDEFHYTSLFTDTIFKYENGMEIPYLLIETGKQNIPPSYLKNRELINKPMKAYLEVMNDTKYSEGFTELGETERFLLTNFLSGSYYFLDKKENKGYYVKDYRTPDLGMPQLVEGNKLIKVWDQDAIEIYQGYIKEGKLKCPDSIKELIDNYDPSYHNPVLVVYYMKQ